MLDLIANLATAAASHAPMGLEASAFLLTVGLCLSSPVYVLICIGKLLDRA